jgi:hypothetical protein
MKRGQEAGGASGRDEKEGARRRVFFHANQHGQSGVDIQESRPMKEGREARGASHRDI